MMAKQDCSELIRLMQQNPELPILPFVAAEVVTDDSGYWLGSWSSAKVDEYVMPTKYYSPVIFKSENDVFDALEKCLSYEEFKSLPDNEEECRPFYDNLPWEKAIIIYIGLPE